MTNYIRLDGNKKKEPKETIFLKYVEANRAPNEPISKPKSFDNVLHLGHDKNYGDVFKAWNDNDHDNFSLYFGVAGDEFQ